MYGNTLLTTIRGYFKMNMKHLIFVLIEQEHRKVLRRLLFRCFCLIKKKKESNASFFYRFILILKYPLIFVSSIYIRIRPANRRSTRSNERKNGTNRNVHAPRLHAARNETSVWFERGFTIILKLSRTDRLSDWPATMVTVDLPNDFKLEIVIRFDPVENRRANDSSMNFTLL